MQGIAGAEVPPAFPLAVIPVGKANDVSRVSGWGNVAKGDWHSHATVPDLLSAVSAAPQVRGARCQACRAACSAHMGA